jgi:ADP-ribosyl-[dinitrogen reductase] hydrolase
MTFDQTDRIIGGILGGAIGDAVGLPFEGKQPPLVAELNGKRISDDTQLTLATCEAIIENNGVVDASLIASHFASWHEKQRVDGMGASTYKALSGLVAGEHWALVGRKGEYAAGNGAAMRIGPLAFCLDPKELETRRVIRDVSRITHHSEEAYVGALAVTIAIRAAWDRTWNGQSTLLALIIDSIPDSKVRDRLLEFSTIGVDTPIFEIGHRFGCSGYVVESVPLALCAVQRISSLGFEGMMRELICAGGDTDTTASISGQVAGTFLGRRALPRHLVMQLEQSSFIEGLAHQFARKVAAYSP